MFIVCFTISLKDWKHARLFARSWHNVKWFLPAQRSAIARFSLSQRVRPSICLSHAGIVSKRLNPS